MIFNKKILSVVLGVLFAGSLATSFYFYRQYTALYQTLPQAAQEDAKKLVAAVGRLIILPTSEEPTIATVIEPDKLRDQPFFASAQKGDKILIYTNAKKAVLYNPTQDKIVEVAPITIGQAAQTAPETSLAPGASSASSTPGDSSTKTKKR